MMSGALEGDTVAMILGPPGMSVRSRRNAVPNGVLLCLSCWTICRCQRPRNHHPRPMCWSLWAIRPRADCRTHKQRCARLATTREHNQKYGTKNDCYVDRYTKEEGAAKENKSKAMRQLDGRSRDGPAATSDSKSKSAQNSP